ncbi:folylpolyglutamate synthase/dihydrofolate synthase family protein [Parabacteroides sp. ZJ-118]|uniref:bifunctional folylpolyglutamate synthase/dihydrofolate synthase n=1 Tax=Parabacteroides sp. ZJ-118 TaxID=2709398 RepID=UPI0013EC1E16|nr:folylpolyglutamate synthase/dihydrofolate synthase family protein [Parabacteroides sp. ZJ-118]
MTYEETLHYLYTRVPVFQHSGASAYKPGLGTSIALDDYLGNPHKAYKTIHVAGTNGKGSVSHLLAAILRQSGFKVGLYTSPHLVDFRERIRVNGKKISQDYVADFIERHRAFFEPLQPSFFELTSSMAFEYFRDQRVDYAVIEAGLGGRLDSTNIITPILSIITNISLDHTRFLGDTVEKIAAEKAGIIKRGVPVLLGLAEKHSVFEVFRSAAREAKAPFHYALNLGMLEGTASLSSRHWKFPSVEYGEVIGELAGEAQQFNAITVFSALHLLREACGVDILPEAVHEGFGHVTRLTGLMGRWQTLRTHPTVVCDTGHNVGGWKHLAEHLKVLRQYYRRIYMIVGMANDKDVDGVLALMPQEACYFFTQASVERAMPAGDFAERARRRGLSGTVCDTVGDAVGMALGRAREEDLVFIGGSTFVVADALPLFMKEDEYK